MKKQTTEPTLVTTSGAECIKNTGVMCKRAIDLGVCCHSVVNM